MDTIGARADPRDDMRFVRLVVRLPGVGVGMLVSHGPSD
jgi:hypothetical protein